MPFKREEKDGQAFFKIKGPMTINETTELKQELLVCLEDYNGLVLDLAEVVECDTAGIQLIYSTKKTVQDTDKAFTVTGASNCVQEIVSSIGLDFEEITKCLGMSDPSSAVDLLRRVEAN